MEKLNIQEYLSLGYVYLLIVGLITDSIFYSYIGINILNYSTFLDILITPINLLTSNYIIAVLLFVIGTLMYFLNIFIQKKRNSPKEETNKKNLFGFAFLILAFYLGLAIGMGTGLKSRIEKNEIKPNYEIVFNNGKKVNVKIIGQNSLYIFYILENQKDVIITPIANTIFQMKKIK